MIRRLAFIRLSLFIPVWSIVVCALLLFWIASYSPVIKFNFKNWSISSSEGSKMGYWKSHFDFLYHRKVLRTPLWYKNALRGCTGSCPSEARVRKCRENCRIVEARILRLYRSDRRLRYYLCHVEAAFVWNMTTPYFSAVVGKKNGRFLSFYENSFWFWFFFIPVAVMKCLLPLRNIMKGQNDRKGRRRYQILKMKSGILLPAFDKKIRYISL